MARTIADIQAEIIATVQADTTLGGLTSTSATAIWRLWTYVIASAIWAHESLWDLFKAEVAEIAADLKPHTLRWYRNKALAYQHGAALVAGEDYYDNTGLDPDDIEAQKIVKQAAVTETPDGLLTVKVAKETSGELAPLSVGEAAAVNAYFGEIKDAGVVLNVRSVNADRLRIEVDVYYDPTILSATGERLDGASATPVQDAAKAYLRALPFDGEFVKARLVDAMQAVEGVNVPEIRLCQARRDDDPSFGGVDVFYQPFSGFLKFYDPSTDLVLNFIAD
jgi:hypothetical protein